MAAAVNLIEPLRHLKVFSPAEFGDRRVDIIGVGATGSRIAIGLAKLGINNLHVWDFDKIESHNLANQAFGMADVGKPKVEALAGVIKAQTGLDIVQHNEKVTGDTELGNIVYLLTDTMASRKEIFEGAIKFKPHIELMVETRMGADEGRIYAVRPIDPSQVSLWLSEWYPDTEASESLCGSRISVGPTAEIVSGYAQWALLSWFKWFQSGNDEDRPSYEMVFGARYPSVMTRQVA